MRTTSPAWAVTAGGPAGWTACADRTTSLWVSRNKDPQRRFSLCLLSGSMLCLLSLLFSPTAFQHHPALQCLPWLPITLSFLSLQPLFLSLLFYFLHHLWFPYTEPTRGRNLLSLSHNAARQPRYFNFLTWMLMTAVGKHPPGCRKTKITLLSIVIRSRKFKSVAGRRYIFARGKGQG